MMSVADAPAEVVDACLLAGWDFDRLLNARVFGQHVYMAVRVDRDEAARRKAVGQPGAVPPSHLERLHTAAEPPAPITHLAGICVQHASAAQAVRSAAMFAGFAPRMVVMREVDLTLAVLTSATVFDVGVASYAEGVCRLLGLPGPRVTAELSLHERALREWAFAAPVNEHTSFVTN